VKNRRRQAIELSAAFLRAAGGTSFLSIRIAAANCPVVIKQGEEEWGDFAARSARGPGSPVAENTPFRQQETLLEAGRRCRDIRRVAEKALLLGARISLAQQKIPRRPRCSGAWAKSTAASSRRPRRMPIKTKPGASTITLPKCSKIVDDKGRAGRADLHYRNARPFFSVAWRDPVILYVVKVCRRALFVSRPEDSPMLKSQQLIATTTGKMRDLVRPHAESRIALAPATWRGAGERS